MDKLRLATLLQGIPDSFITFTGDSAKSSCGGTDYILVILVCDLLDGSKHANGFLNLHCYSISCGIKTKRLTTVRVHPIAFLTKKPRPGDCSRSGEPSPSTPLQLVFNHITGKIDYR